MAGVRSPNYPNHNITQALELARKLYDKDGRNKVSKVTLAKHLGHDAVSGPALGKIGAMRAFGLISGTGDELQITPDAVAALKAPEGSAERKDALVRLAFNPGIFQEIRKQYPSRPSRDALTYWLETKNFSDAASTIAAQCYLETLAVVESLEAGYNPPEAETEKEEPSVTAKNAMITAASKQGKVSNMAGERELTTGMLSKTAGFRLIVNGEIGVKEIERLIAKLELDKEILADSDAADLEEALK